MVLALLALGVAATVSQEARAADKDEAAEAAKKFRGSWKGEMVQEGIDPFPVIVHIGEFREGKWSGVLIHPAIPGGSAEGKLLGIKVEGKKMTLAATIFKGRDICLDGITELTLDDDNTMTRVWIDPRTGTPGAVGKLRRQPD
jgi:hypothetical protein